MLSIRSQETSARKSRMGAMSQSLVAECPFPQTGQHIPETFPVVTYQIRPNRPHHKLRGYGSLQFS